jgi:drug/metabolite transporter (DMT)-like permease
MLTLIFLVHALFGFTMTLGKMMLLYAPPIFIIGIRMLFGGAVLLMYLSYKNQIRCHLASRDYWLYFQVAFFGFFVFYCARSWAFQYVTVTKMGFMANLMPFFTALFAYFFHKEKLTIHKLAGLSIGFFGLIPILMNNPSSESHWGELFSISLPEFVILCAFVSLSYSNIVMQKLVKHRQCSPLFANGLSMLASGMFAMTASVAFETVNIVHWPQFLACIIAQIVLSNLVCSNLYAHLLKHYSATFMSFTGFISPLFTAFYGKLFFGDTISINFLISFILVVIGLSIYYYDDFHRSLKPSLHKNADESAIMPVELE